MAISPAELGGDEDLARRVLVLARVIAPCIDTFADDSEQKKDALAILRGIVGDTGARGSRFVRSEGVGSASVSYERAARFFTADDRDGLLSLCGAKTGPSAASKARFPKPGPIGRVWPERY